MRNSLSVLSFFATFFAAFFTAAHLTAQNTFPQQPCKAFSLKGDITYYNQLVLRGDPITEIQGIRFSNTSDVLVLIDRYQRNFYVVPRTYTFNEYGISCSDARTDCTPIVKDNLGNVVMALTVDRPAPQVESNGKSDAPATYYYRTETMRYEPVPSQKFSEISVVTPQAPATSVKTIRVIAPQQSQQFKVIARQ